ncbi:30S ribosomal protein S5 [bioreactor metagenome]|jgi:small subunit ribosomal protein S5|uniref:30S ribosomal protein S5 n=1 Tax=bioreactor metagenome TaxID=1076179 RepID=A0A644W682_9ZZZZ|nr:30S ribosomal protein S5 [Aminivibrio sp.]MDD3514696.1 30S ribosomal protein S5 [Synergistaceae bacterium]MEA4952550.1 30S ribosomal protein S5 [Aminivibrio sp.]NCB16569.1 30S ribosomal protein S5 [Synergistales bacterium]HPF85040.1 30S ribosomal protein S5 [Aminivibrio sp.]
MIRKKIDAKGMELTERVVAINRVSKVVKGGKRFKFSVLVVVGDGDRYVGVGMGKAKEISEAVRKGIDKAGKSLVELKRIGNTIPHPVNGVFGAASVLLKPAVPGTGVIAGGVVRAIMELGGVKDVVAKVIGRTSNPINVAWATVQALEEMRTPDEILRLRGKKSPEAAAE